MEFEQIRAIIEKRLKEETEIYEKKLQELKKPSKFLISHRELKEEGMELIIENTKIGIAKNSIITIKRYVNQYIAYEFPKEMQKAFKTTQIIWFSKNTGNFIDMGTAIRRKETWKEFRTPHTNYGHTCMGNFKIEENIINKANEIDYDAINKIFDIQKEIIETIDPSSLLSKRTSKKIIQNQITHAKRMRRESYNPRPTQQTQTINTRGEQNVEQPSQQ